MKASAYVTNRRTFATQLQAWMFARQLRKENPAATVSLVRDRPLEVVWLTPLAVSTGSAVL